MNIYAHDLSLLDFNLDYSDPTTDPFVYRRNFSSNSVIGLLGDDDEDDEENRNRSNRVVPDRSPPKHRHDGTSPLPLGMDWSHPPRKWVGQDSVWPHDPHTGWSYCVTIPSWTFLPKSRGSNPVAFYRVQIGVQSPEGVTSTRGILRRYNDFLKLFSELKKAFPRKNLAPPPPRRILRIKSRTSLEERRSSLEDWMEKLLSDIDISRSAPVATFLELEASVRSFFDNANHQASDEVSSTSGMVSSFLHQTSSDVSILATNTSIASDQGNDTPYEVSELGDDIADFSLEKSVSEQDIMSSMETTIKNGVFSKNFIWDGVEKISRRKGQTETGSRNRERDKITEDISNVKPLRMDGTHFFNEVEDFKLNSHTRRLSTESIGSDLSTVRASEISNLGVGNLFGDFSFDLGEGSEAPRGKDGYPSLDFRFSRDSLYALPSDERLKLNRVLSTMQRRLLTARTDVEDLIARLNQEVAVKQFLTTKVKDLELELETTKENCQENMQQTAMTEKERITQMQWDMEELRGKCLELELKLETERDEKVRAESTKVAVVEENKMLLHELDTAREQFENLQKYHEEFEAKSKTDVKLLVKEVKTLRNSQTDLKQELSRLIKENLELERVLQKEKQRMEHVNTANMKLLHECGILQNRLQECSVNFLVEEENKLIMDTSSPSDAVDLLATSDNRIGLLLAEAQLLAQDLESADMVVEETADSNASDRRETVNALKKLLMDVFVDNARLRMQVNSVMRCALNTDDVRSEKGDQEEDDTSSRKTVLSKFLER